MNTKERDMARTLAMYQLKRPLKEEEVVSMHNDGEVLIFDNISTFKKYTNGFNKYLFGKTGEGVITCLGFNPASPYRRVCPVCGKEFYLKDLATKKTCCSKECAALNQRDEDTRKYLLLPNPYMRDYTGQTIPKIIVHGGIKIGRQLAENETVIPIDGNPENLDPFNLKVVTTAELNNINIRNSALNPTYANNNTVRFSAGNMVKKICKNCGNEFLVKGYPSEVKRREFCSKSCARRYTNGEFTKNKNPYRELYKPGYPGAKANGSIMEHRYVAQEEILHRQMKPEERIIHLDGVNLNNDPNNLLVVDSSKSANLYQYNHPSELKLTQNEDGAYNVKKLTQVVEIHRPEYTRVCQNCGKTFYVMDKNNPGLFCSMNCELKFNKRN